MRVRLFRLPAMSMLALAVVWAGVSLSGCTTTMDRSELATEYYNLGTAFFDLGDLPRSADYLSRAIELDESLARASYNLARVYALQGRFDEAEELLQSLRLMEPENTTVIETLGYVAYSRGDMDGATAAYDQVLEIDPGNVNALYNRAKIADESDELELAADFLRSASVLEDRDAGILELLASVEERLGNSDGAISALEDLRALGSVSVEARLRLAGLYEGAERYDLALEELEIVIAAAEDLASQAEALFRKGRILVTAAQEPDAGLQALRMAFEAGFLDMEQIDQLRENPAIDDLGEVRDLLAEHAPPTPDQPVEGSSGEAEESPADPPEAPAGE
jgi:tetratricopeptide (TPR) repeat protein